MRCGATRRVARSRPSSVSGSPRAPTTPTNRVIDGIAGERPPIDRGCARAPGHRPRRRCTDQHRIDPKVLDRGDGGRTCGARRRGKVQPHRPERGSARHASGARTQFTRSQRSRASTPCGHATRRRSVLPTLPRARDRFRRLLPARAAASCPGASARPRSWTSRTAGGTALAVSGEQPGGEPADRRDGRREMATAKGDHVRAAGDWRGCLAGCATSIRSRAPSRRAYLEQNARGDRRRRSPRRTWSV